jgi:hypothetical protein
MHTKLRQCRSAIKHLRRAKRTNQSSGSGHLSVVGIQCQLVLDESRPHLTRTDETPCATASFVTVTIHWRSGEGREGATSSLRPLTDEQFARNRTAARPSGSCCRSGKPPVKSHVLLRSRDARRWLKTARPDCGGVVENTGELGLLERCPFEIGAGEICARQIGVPEVCVR